MTNIFNKKITFSPLSIVSTYALLASLWIIITDSLMGSNQQSEFLYFSYQTLKGMFFVVITSILVFMMTNRSFKTQKHLNSVLSVLSDVNQLIVREKKVSKLLQKSCDILASSHIYRGAWIMTLDENDHIDNLIYSDNSKEYEVFKKKVKKDWTPHCISKIPKADKFYSFTKNPLKECSDCPKYRKLSRRCKA
jgi:hypothetical protein